jgi:hypothetical protein
MIGRTNVATYDIISSSCSLSDGKDVWYSVVGTGDTIVATTCSYHRVRAHSWMSSLVQTLVKIWSASRPQNLIARRDSMEVWCRG